MQPEQEPQVEVAPAAPASSGTGRAALDRHLIRGIAWTGAAKYGGQIIRWASTLVVVRHLTPGDYGIFGMAGVFVGLVALLNEFGVGTAIVTLPNLDRKQISQINGAAILFGVVAAAFTCLMAKPLSLFYDSPEVVGVTLALSLNFVIRSFRSVPLALLQKELRFKLFAALETVETLFLAALMVAMAVAGFGYWTLVIGDVLGGLLGTILILTRRRHPIAWPRFREIRTAMLFSWHVVSQRLTWFWYSNSDYVIAGRFLGKAALGVYAFGYQIASLPVEKITALVGRVTPAFFAAVQKDPAELRRYFLRVTEGISVLTIPACWGLALVTDTLVPLALGEKWMGAIFPLKVLALYAAWRSIEALFHQVLLVVGEARYGMQVGFVAAVVLPLSFYAGSHWDTAGIAVAWVIVHPILLTPLYRRVMRKLDMPASQYFAAVGPSILCALGMVVLVLAFRAIWPMPSSLGLRLGIEVSLGAASYAGLMIGLFRKRVATFRSVLAAIRK